MNYPSPSEVNPPAGSVLGVLLTSCVSVEEAMELELLDILSVFPSLSDFSSELSESMSPSPLSTKPRACNAWGGKCTSIKRATQYLFFRSDQDSSSLERFLWQWIIASSFVTQLTLSKALDEGTAVAESLQVAIDTTGWLFWTALMWEWEWPLTCQFYKFSKSFVTKKSSHSSHCRRSLQMTLWVFNHLLVRQRWKLS